MKSFFKSAAAFSLLSAAAALPAIAQQAAPAPGAAMPMQGMTMPVKHGATPAEGSMMSAMARMSRGGRKARRLCREHGLEK